MSSAYSAFSYKSGRTFVHRLPAWIKLLFIPLFNIAVFSLNPVVALCFIVLQAVLFFCLRFTVQEQLTDAIPVIWYGVFLYIIGFGTVLYTNLTQENPLPFLQAAQNAFSSAFGDRKTLSLVLKFFACNQSASLMFKTSTSLELKAGIETIEKAVRRFLPCKKEPRFSTVVSMFINFIPAVFKLWNQLKLSWKARGGKNSLRMYLVLFPVLFSTGLKYAFNTAKALIIRSEDR